MLTRGLREPDLHSLDTVRQKWFCQTQGAWLGRGAGLTRGRADGGPGPIGGQPRGCHSTWRAIDRHRTQSPDSLRTDTGNRIECNFLGLRVDISLVIGGCVCAGQGWFIGSYCGHALFRGECCTATFWVCRVIDLAQVASGLPVSRRRLDGRTRWWNFCDTATERTRVRALLEETASFRLVSSHPAEQAGPRRDGRTPSAARGRHAKYPNTDVQESPGSRFHGPRPVSSTGRGARGGDLALQKRRRGSRGGCW